MNSRLPYTYTNDRVQYCRRRWGAPTVLRGRCSPPGFNVFNCAEQVRSKAHFVHSIFLFRAVPCGGVLPRFTGISRVLPDLDMVGVIGSIPVAPPTMFADQEQKSRATWIGSGKMG